MPRSTRILLIIFCGILYLSAGYSPSTLEGDKGGVCLTSTLEDDRGECATTGYAPVTGAAEQTTSVQAGISGAAEQTSKDAFTPPDSALPVAQIGRDYLPTTTTTARNEQSKRLTSIYSPQAQQQLKQSNTLTIKQSSNIPLSLPPSKISFPFCTFW